MTTRNSVATDNTDNSMSDEATQMWEVVEEAPQPAPRKNKGVRSLREHILTAEDGEREDVFVDGWGVWIQVRSLNGAERARFQKQITQQQNGVTTINWDRFWPDLVILASYDPDDGVRVFEPADRDGLLLKNSKNLEKVAAVARRLSGLDENALANSKSEDSED
jgi:hypothetical protein